MKTIFSTALVAMMMALCTTSASAQDSQTRKQRPTPEQRSEAQARRIASQLALDDATTGKFVDAWKQYQSELQALRPQKAKKQDGQQAQQQPRQHQQLTEQQAEQILKARIENGQKVQQIREKYYKTFSKFLTQKQILRISQMQQKGKKGFGKKGKGMRKGHQAKKGRQHRGKGKTQRQQRSNA